MFALGYEATGLGRRIALLLVKLLGKRTLGLGYAVALADLVLAPFMPSNTARSGGTIYPVVKNIPPLYGSTPDHEPRKIGSCLMWTGFATTNVTSSMFLTALAPNLLAVELARKIGHVDITWTVWLVGFLPACWYPAICSNAAADLCAVSPAAQAGTEVVMWAGQQLQQVGPMTRREITMALLALAALTAWIFGLRWVAPVTVAMAVISLMIITRVVGWSDIATGKDFWRQGFIMGVVYLAVLLIVGLPFVLKLA